MIRKDGIILWPAYFERRIPRNKGRRVPLKLASDNVTADTIARACKALGFECEIVEGAYPKMWWRKTGYVIVKADSLRKNELIRKVAEQLRKK